MGFNLVLYQFFLFDLGLLTQHEYLNIDFSLIYLFIDLFIFNFQWVTKAAWKN